MPGPDVHTLLERIHRLEIKMVKLSVTSSIATAVAMTVCQAIIMSIFK